MTAIRESAASAALLLGSAVIITLLSGCQTSETRSAETPASEAAAVEPAPAPAPTLQEVILALDAGRVDAAENQLLDILERRPNSRLANRLLTDIRRDPETLMDSEYIEVTVAEGESLSQIAERELGDAMQFFALARYNEIAVPRRLEPGQTLRIPDALKVLPVAPVEAPSRGSSETPAETAAVNVEPVAAPVDQRERLNETIRGLLDMGRHDLARRLLILVAYAGQLDAAGSELLAEASLASAADREARGELSAAVGRLEAGLVLLNDDDGAALAAERDRLQSRVLFAEGMEHRRADRPDEALEQLERSAALDPGFAAAREEAARLREAMVQQRHEAALIHYRDQRLEAAIELWQAVVRLDPDFEPAQRYLTRARALQSSLREMD